MKLNYMVDFALWYLEFKSHWEFMAFMRIAPWEMSSGRILILNEMLTMMGGGSGWGNVLEQRVMKSKIADLQSEKLLGQVI